MGFCSPIGTGPETPARGSVEDGVQRGDEAVERARREEATVLPHAIISCSMPRWRAGCGVGYPSTYVGR